MNTGESTRNGESPARVYSRALQALQRAQAVERRREARLGYAKLAIAVLTLILAFVLLRYPSFIEFLAAPVAIFIVLAVMQEKLIRSLRFRARSITFYERGLARLNDHWAGTGESGDRFLDPLHPYARDLDLFGRASLFELLCTARTRAGEETLSAWLLAAAPVDEVLARQSAVRDLTHRLSFRENLFLLGETVRLGVQPNALAAWGERKPVFPSRVTRVVTTVLGILWIVSLVAWGVWGLEAIAGAVSLLNLAWAHRLYTRLDEAADAAEKATQDLELLAGVLSLLERENFSSAKLIGLQVVLKRDGVPPSVAIRKLARVVEHLKARRNLFLRPFDIFTFWSAQLVFAAERWQQEFGPAIRGWLSAVGELEALTALSAYAYEHPDDVFPEFVVADPDGKLALFDADDLAHPLLPTRKAVRNNLKLGDGLQLIILSGPNMAGKSTFIRSIGANAVLAQCGAPVRAARLRLSPLTVAASICILDSLSGGVSRFYAEIHRIKLVSDLTLGSVPVLFLLDELFSGTNSHDRLTGTEFIVRSLIERNAIGMVSTHDLALAKIPESIGQRAANFCFEDRFEDGQLIFDYKLKPGIVQASNALELMRSIGLGVGG
ncbi:MAG: mismatch repair protein [Terracidiphilus sp.]